MLFFLIGISRIFIPYDDMTPEEYRNQLLQKTKGFYSKIEKVYSPCIKDHIYFNAQGFHHLQYENSGTPRTIAEQIYKLKLFPLVIPTIKKCKVVDEKKIVRIHVGRKKKAKIKDAEFWSLVHDGVGKKGKAKVRVIIRKIGTGNFIYWSVMKLGG